MNPERIFMTYREVDLDGHIVGWVVANNTGTQITRHLSEPDATRLCHVLNNPVETPRVRHWWNVAAAVVVAFCVALIINHMARLTP